LDKIPELVGKKLTGKTCAGMKGVLEEVSEVLEDTDKGTVRDAAPIAASQRVVHYEMAGYGSAREFAKLLGLPSAFSSPPQPSSRASWLHLPRVCSPLRSSASKYWSGFPSSSPALMTISTGRAMPFASPSPVQYGPSPTPFVGPANVLLLTEHPSPKSAPPPERQKAFDPNGRLSILCLCVSNHHHRQW
jgi:hypothetical protein